MVIIMNVWRWHLAQFRGEKVELSLGSKQAQNLEKGFVCAWGELFLKSQAGSKVYSPQSVGIAATLASQACQVVVSPEQKYTGIIRLLRNEQRL